MNIRYTENARQGEEGLVLLQQASSCLEEMLGKSAGSIMATWDRSVNGKGRPVYTLQLSDGISGVSDAFTSSELRRPAQLRYRLQRLWGDLLEVRSHKQLEALAVSEAPERE